MWWLSHHLLRLTAYLLLFLLMQRCQRSWLLLNRCLLIRDFLAERFSMWFWAWIVWWWNISCSWWLDFGIKALVKVRTLDLSDRFDFFSIKLTYLVTLLRPSATISIDLLLKNCSGILCHHSMALWRFALRCRLSRLWVMLGQAVGQIVADHKILFHYHAAVLLLCSHNLLLLLGIARLNRMILLLHCLNLCS